jgi:hypothetical protein
MSSAETLYSKAPRTPQEWHGLFDDLIRRISGMEDLLKCLADVASNNQPDMSSGLYGALDVASGLANHMKADIYDLQYAVNHLDMRR